MRRESFLEPAFYFYRFYYMKKVGLLFFALAACCASAFAGDAFYIIKDGKFQNGASFNPFEDEEKGDNVIEEGNGYATIKHSGSWEKSLETRISVPAGLYIGKKNLIIEYMVDALDIFNDENGENNGHTCEAISKPTIIIECFDEESMAWVDSYTDASESRSHILTKISIDGKTEGCDKEWQKYNEFSFANRNTEVKTILIAYKREVTKNSGSILKIKNLYFETDADKFPIYGCQFLGANLYEERQQLSTLARAPYTDVLYQDGISLNWDKSIKSVEKKDAHLFISYEGGLDDGSGIPASEINTCLPILAIGMRYQSDETPYSISFDTIPLPEEAVKEGKVRLECYAKHHGQEDIELVGNVNGVNEDELLPIYVTFDNKQEAVPAFKDSIINGTWTKEVGFVDVPAGAKSIIVEFRQNINVSYLVDKFVISYKGKVGVATVNGESKTLTVYPNPVSEAIEFAGIEDIQSVEIVSLNGAVKACSVVNNKVNVSNLAAGEYVIIVNKNITGKFIKK